MPDIEKPVKVPKSERTDLHFDTETTGKFNNKLSFTHESQPNLVQLGMAIIDPFGFAAHQLEFIIKPEGWEIPDEAADIHGITTEYALAYGFSLKTVLGTFNMFCRKANHGLVAFNLDFDKSIMLTALHRAGISDADMTRLYWDCAMKRAALHCQIPSKVSWSTDYAWPSLSVAHEKLLGTGFDGAHSALADTLACARIYHAMDELEKKAGK